MVLTNIRVNDSGLRQLSGRVLIETRAQAMRYADSVLLLGVSLESWIGILQVRGDSKRPNSARG